MLVKGPRCFSHGINRWQATTCYHAARNHNVFCNELSNLWTNVWKLKQVGQGMEFIHGILFLHLPDYNHSGPHGDIKANLHISPYLILFEVKRSCQEMTHTHTRVCALKEGKFPVGRHTHIDLWQLGRGILVLRNGNTLPGAHPLGVKLKSS